MRETPERFEEVRRGDKLVWGRDSYTIKRVDRVTGCLKIDDNGETRRLYQEIVNRWLDEPHREFQIIPKAKSTGD